MYVVSRSALTQSEMLWRQPGMELFLRKTLQCACEFLATIPKGENIHRYPFK